MVKIADEEITRVHLLLYSRDLVRIRTYFGGRMKTSDVVRNMVRKFLDHMDAKALEGAKPLDVAQPEGIPEAPDVG